jgi:glycosyltransferase involved in cell wall biosynthesis
MAMARAMVGACDAIICQSQQAADALAALMPQAAAKTTVVSNWIDAATAQGELAASNQATPQREMERPVPTLLFLGQLENYKSPQTLLAAADLLRQRGVRFRLVIGGDGSLRETLKRQTNELQLCEIVELRGWLHGQAKAEAFRTADIFVLPSLEREGVPNVLLEAMAAGLPIVATQVSGIPSIIAQNVNGLLVPPGDAAALARAIEQLLNDPQGRQSMGSANRDAALQHDVQNVWPRLAEVILGTAMHSGK